jgi:hypothetical protein
VAEDGPAERDTAADAGRLTGRAVTAIGRRLLRMRPVRRAIQRAAEEARTDPSPPSPGDEEKS